MNVSLKKKLKSMSLTWRELSKNLVIFLAGGTIYYIIEFVYKSFISNSPTHWTMFLLGGILALFIDLENEYIPWEMSLIKQGCLGALVITILEFIFGVILNIWLGLGIWDYSHLPFNIIGQICLPFTIIWFFLALVWIFLADWLRYWWFDEERPHYHLM